MASTINSFFKSSSGPYKPLPLAPNFEESSNMEQDMMSRELPPLPQRKSSKPMSIPRRAVGSPAGVIRKPSKASFSSSIYTDTRSRSESESSHLTKDSLSYTESEFRKTPPIPEKDEQRQKSTAAPTTPNQISASPKSISSLRSSPGQELWRRRSLKTKTGIEFPDLKLLKSNGSTAGPPSQTVNPPPDRSLPKLPVELPKSRATSDRGRDLIPSREAPQPPLPESQMGAKVSKLKNTGKRKVSVSDASPSGRNGNGTESDGSQQSSDSPFNDIYKITATHSPVGRLSTPEYLHTEKTHQRQPSTPTVLSPTTPTDEKSFAPQVPNRSAARPNPSTPQESPLLPNLLTQTTHSRDPSETLTITSLPPIVRSPQPQKPRATKTILTPQPSPPEMQLSSDTSTHTNPKSHSHSMSSSDTLNTNTTNTSTSTTMRHTRQTSSRTTTTQSYSYSYFPLSPSALPSPGTITILPAPAITTTHLQCHTQHKLMRRSRNDICPLQCQTCAKADLENKWKCTWCCLRVCQECMVVLAENGKDLKVMMEGIGSREMVDADGDGDGVQV